jgi:hypothetical protein
MKVEKTEENIVQCRCLSCPSYAQLCKMKNADENLDRTTAGLQNRTHYEKMFCAFERSNCIHLDRGCLCENCLVHAKYNLHNHEYCLKSGGL